MLPQAAHRARATRVAGPRGCKHVGRVYTLVTVSKGSPIISVRLPQDIHDWYEQRAKAQQESLSVYVRRQLIRFHAHTVERAQTAEEVSTPAQVSTPGCLHRSPTLIGGGLARCRDCSATRGIDGTWRPG